jgi:hypothetical protein
MKEVEGVRPLKTRFRVMCLAYLNEAKDVADDYRERLRASWGPARVEMAAQLQYGDGAVDRLYTELGVRFHNQGREKSRETVEEALVAAGLPASLADAMGDESLDDAVKSSHHEGVDLVGDDVGTPIIRVDGQAFFGPVVTPMPRGEDAGRLWDGVLLVTSTDGFFELKRTRTVRPSFD